jgi:phage baseplate assembly protein gpV
MKMAKVVLCLGTVAMAWASAAKSYNVTLNNPAQVSGTELKAGTYSVVLAGDKAMIHSGKVSVEAPVTVQEGDKKFSATSVRYVVVDGKYHIKEIQLSGTKTMLVFNN